VLRALLGHRDVDASLLPDGSGRTACFKFGVPRPVPVYIGAMARDARDGGPARGRCAAAALPARTLRHGAAAGLRVRRLGPAGRGRPAGLLWVSLSGDPAAARAALAEKLAYYGPRSRPRCSAPAGLRPQDFGPAAALAHAGRRRPGSSTTACWPWAWPGRGRRAGPLPRAATAGREHLSFGPPLGPDPVAASACWRGGTARPELRGA